MQEYNEKKGCQRMPVFHTKTIESILEPVAQQVSRLVIFHEEVQDGNAMPDLSRPVEAVSRAVINLARVGRDTINTSQDPILRHEMPSALHQVERAARLLEEASKSLREDPFSQNACSKLIEGSRGILQGTSAILLSFDDSEVRKIIKGCYKILEYINIAEVIETMEDLIKFVKDLSPSLTQLSRDIDNREKELTHQIHREMLVRVMESIKNLTPILICAMKAVIHIIANGGPAMQEVVENRSFLIHSLTEDITELVRILQLTTYDEDEWDADFMSILKKLESGIGSRLKHAHDWLEDPTSVTGGFGERAVRQILECGHRVAGHCLAADRQAIEKMCGDLASMTDALCELRQDNKGGTPQAEAVAHGINQKLKELSHKVSEGIVNLKQSGYQQPAHTLLGRMEQAMAWLSNPTPDNTHLGQVAISLIVDEAQKLGQVSPDYQEKINEYCSQIDYATSKMLDLCKTGKGSSLEAKENAFALKPLLEGLKAEMQKALYQRVVKDFLDISPAIKQFTEVVTKPQEMGQNLDTAQRNQFELKAKQLNDFTNRITFTAAQLATAEAPTKKVAESLLTSANQISSFTPHLIKAGKIRMAYPNNKTIDEHFENLRKQYEEKILKLRDLADEAKDTSTFIRATEESLVEEGEQCEKAAQECKPQQFAEHTVGMARLAQRVVMVAQKECENSEDATFVAKLNQATHKLHSDIQPFAQDGKEVAMTLPNSPALSKWRTSKNKLISNVKNVYKAISDIPEEDEHQELQISRNLNELHVSAENNITNGTEPCVMELLNGDSNQDPPPRPPLPQEDVPPPRPPLPADLDDEDEINFPAPQPNQPIMMAAHGLHQEMKQWSSQDNQIVAAAKQMALLMAQLSGLVRGEGSSKKDLIACAKAIADASEEVSQLAKGLAQMCTDKRMRMNILQVCERIPTIGTQLRILSTVKATMLGAHGTEEDREATEMLVGNAQNLMQSVKETVRACEAAHIKLRSGGGIRMKWVRKQPWYQLIP